MAKDIETIKELFAETKILDLIELLRIKKVKDKNGNSYYSTKQVNKKFSQK